MAANLEGQIRSQPEALEQVLQLPHHARPGPRGRRGIPPGESIVDRRHRNEPARRAARRAHARRSGPGRGGGACDAIRDHGPGDRPPGRHHRREPHGRDGVRAGGPGAGLRPHDRHAHHHPPGSRGAAFDRDRAEGDLRDLHGQLHDDGVRVRACSRRSSARTASRPTLAAVPTAVAAAIEARRRRHRSPPERLLVFTAPVHRHHRGEGALKVREAARFPAEGFDAEYLLHGQAVPLERHATPRSTALRSSGRARCWVRERRRRGGRASPCLHGLLRAR